MAKNGNKKHGRNKKRCEAYRRSNQREKNKIKKMLKHLARHHETDTDAIEQLAKLVAVVRGIGLTEAMRSARDMSQMAHTYRTLKLKA